MGFFRLCNSMQNIPNQSYKLLKRFPFFYSFLSLLIDLIQGVKMSVSFFNKKEEMMDYFSFLVSSEATSSTYRNYLTNVLALLEDTSNTKIFLIDSLDVIIFPTSLTDILLD